MKKIIVILWSVTISFAATAKSEAKINQLQLQEEIQRFYTRFTERLIETSFRNDGSIKFHGQDGLRKYLLYDSEALKIATGPFPVANLLDMLVFIKLNKIVLEYYWIPKVHKKSGKALLEAFVDAEKDIDQVALKVMNMDQLTHVNQYIINWRLEHTNQIRVEKVRLSDISRFAKMQKKEKTGFSIVDTESAVQAVDQMLLVANRSLFLAQQMPLLLRLHARLGTREIMSDTISSLQSAPSIINKLNETQPLIHDLQYLVGQTDKLIKNSSALIKLMPKGIKEGSNFGQTLTQIDGILVKTNHLVDQLKTGQSDNVKTVRILKEQIKNMIWFIALVTIIVACLVSAVWWTGSYLSKKLLMKHRQH